MTAKGILEQPLFCTNVTRRDEVVTKPFASLRRHEKKAFRFLRKKE
jgi:hypothetical protein